MHSHPDMLQPDKIPDCISYTYSQFQPESASQSHLHIERSARPILSTYTEIFLHSLPTVRKGIIRFKCCFQFRPQSFEFHFPIVGNPVGITDFLNGLAADGIRKPTAFHPPMNNLRLKNSQLCNQPGLRHLYIIVIVCFHQRQHDHAPAGK